MPSKQSRLPSSETPVALVTGAGRRVGEQLARALAAAGYRVALHANHSLKSAEATARELESAGTEAIALAADLRDEAALRRMIDLTHEHFGRIDALVNNAAIWESKPLEAVTAEDVRKHFEINTLGTFICCQAAGLIMAAQRSGGAIVNTGDWAIARPYVDHAAYFVSKGGIPTLTRMFAVELGRRNPNVRVNALMPGPVMLPQSLTSAERQAVVAATLVKRAGSPQDVAQAVLYLLQNTFVTGTCLVVDGGRSVFAPDEGGPHDTPL